VCFSLSCFKHDCKNTTAFLLLLKHLHTNVMHYSSANCGLLFFDLYFPVFTSQGCRIRAHQPAADREDDRHRLHRTKANIEWEGQTMTLRTWIDSMF